MSDLRELYQEMIVQHARNPRNFRGLAGGNRTAEGYNPLCGDKVTIQARVEGGVVREIAFQGAGCAISTASASLMTESLAGKTLEEAEDLFRRFHDLVTGQRAGGSEPLGKLEVFAGVSEFPVRVKCASLPWHTMRAALAGEAGAVTTE